MRRGDVLLTKGLIYEALGLTNLFFTKGGGDGGTQGSVNTVGAFGGTLPEGVLVGV